MKCHVVVKSFLTCTVPLSKHDQIEHIITCKDVNHPRRYIQTTDLGMCLKAMVTFEPGLHCVASGLPSCK